jgi:hypothetical protein
MRQVMKEAAMRTRQVVLIAALSVAATGTAIAEDDLAVVKRAVARKQVARQEAQATTAPATVEEPIRRTGDSGRDLRWFKVRITEKGAKKARVNVNVPIALVRALGDDFPIDIGHHAGWRGGRDKAVRLGEVLATLEAGQSLVEIDDDEATVRIWVE